MLNRTTLPLFALTCGVLICCQTTYATKYAQPTKPWEVKSNNGKYVLVVNPKTEQHRVFAADDKSKPLWSFSLRVWLSPFVLSNDGKTVATLAWQHVTDETGGRKIKVVDQDCVVFWRDTGKWKQHTFEHIIPNPPRTQDIGRGPIGGFWRTWYSGHQTTDTGFTVHLTDGGKCSFSFKTGEMTSRVPELKPEKAK